MNPGALELEVVTCHYLCLTPECTGSLDFPRLAVYTGHILTMCCDRRKICRESIVWCFSSNQRQLWNCTSLFYCNPHCDSIHCSFLWLLDSVLKSKNSVLFCLVNRRKFFSPGGQYRFSSLQSSFLCWIYLIFRPLNKKKHNKTITIALDCISVLLIL